MLSKIKLLLTRQSGSEISSIRKFSIRESEKFNSDIENSKFRRQSWNTAVQVMRSISKSFVKELEEASYPYTFTIDDNTNSKSRLKFFSIVGNRENLRMLPMEEDKEAIVFEQGASLVFSQSFSGEIVCIFYPCSSYFRDLTESKESQPELSQGSDLQKEFYLLRLSGLLPEKLTHALISKIIREYLFYLRATTIHRRLSRIDQLYLWWMNICSDWKKKWVSLTNNQLSPILPNLFVKFFPHH